MPTAKAVTTKRISLLLPHLFQRDDPRLNQYLLALHQAGFSLRAIAEVSRKSHETIRTRVHKAGIEQERGYFADLTALPEIGRITHPQRKSHSPKPVLSPQMKALLRDMNAEAKRYRNGKDRSALEAFHMMILDLDARGVPFVVIAEACEQDPRHLRRRLKAWGITPRKSTSRTWPALLSQEPKEPEPLPILLPEDRVNSKGQRCIYPDCPSRTGAGMCIH